MSQHYAMLDSLFTGEVWGCLAITILIIIFIVIKNERGRK